MIKNNALLDTDLIFQKIQIKESMKVADLGCGLHGHFVFVVSKLIGRYGIVYAVDILKTVLDTLKKKAALENIKNIKTIWTDLEIFGATKIESGSLDVALLINTLYQSKKHSEIVRESARLLKKDGKLFISDWKEAACGPPREKKVKTDSLKVILEKAGFRKEEEFDVGKYHFGMIFVKN